MLLAPDRPGLDFDASDDSPAHELAVERFAASHVGALGRETLHAIQIHAARAVGRRGWASDGAAVALAWLNEVGGAGSAELAALMGRSKSWADDLNNNGRRIAGEPPRAAGRKRAAGRRHEESR